MLSTSNLEIGFGARRAGVSWKVWSSRGTILAAILAAGLCAGVFVADGVNAQEITQPERIAGVASAPLAPAAARPASRAEAVKLAMECASPEAREVIAWVMATGDNHGMPFVIVDKKQTKVLVFDGAGRLVGDTSALIGLARGDDSAPGVGIKNLSDIRPQERTTPAGRFVASLGQGGGKHDILWVDYASALDLHRVLPANSHEHRLERLASTSPLDHRITFGCINVPAAFYDAVIDPAFAATSGIVYILPETRANSAVFAIGAYLADSASEAIGSVPLSVDN